MIDITGLNQHLELELFAGFQNQFLDIHDSYGFKIIIYNQSEDINHIAGFQKISVPTHSETNIALSRTFVEKLKKPYSKCEINDNEPVDESLFSRSEFYRMMTMQNKTYRQAGCYRECFEKIVLKECGCIVGDCGKIFYPSLIFKSYFIKKIFI